MSDDFPFQGVNKANSSVGLGEDSSTNPITLSGDILKDVLDTDKESLCAFIKQRWMIRDAEFCLKYQPFLDRVEWLVLEDHKDMANLVYCLHGKPTATSNLDADVGLNKAKDDLNLISIRNILELLADDLLERFKPGFALSLVI